MVRVNLIDPRLLADQHLVAEYNELLMLAGYVKRYPQPVNIPKEYALGTGHIRFFKDKLRYLEKRHVLLRREMKRRGFAVNKKLDVTQFPDELKKDWTPEARDVEIILRRLREKVKKQNFYRFEGQKRTTQFFQALLDRAKH